jgi:folate-binding protein YgfZ
MKKKLTKLSNRSILSVSGKDSEQFLQGIVTCDIKNIRKRSSYGSILTPQGKLLYDFIISKINNNFLIDTSESNMDSLIKLLNIYKLRSEVSLDKRDDLSVFVSMDNKKENPNAVDPRISELGTREILDSNNEFFNSDQDSYEKQKIKLGIAEVGSEIKSGELFPMEANLDYLKGIDFKKGCFIGQEVTSRMYRKGKVKKRIIAFESKDTFTSNEELVYNNQTIGAVIKKIDDYGLALVKIEKIINPEREKIKITTKNNDKNVIFILPDFFSE